ncbi:MAG: 2OG-Fe(II) oxygenase [Kiloniellales bacterium]
MDGPAHDISVGDRAPNFVLPGPDGAFLMFYERTKGRPVVLLFCPGRRSPGARGEVEAFDGLAPEFAAAGVDIFLVSLDGVEDNARLNAPFLVWSDPKRAITAAFLNGAGIAFDPGRPPGDGVTAFLLDANQRVLAIQTGADQAERALAFYRARPPAEASRVLASSAPVLLLPEVIDRRMCRELIDLWQTKGHDEGPVGSVAGGAEVERVYHSMKKRLDHAIMDADINRTLQRTIGRRLAPEMAKAFCTEALRFDRFLVVCYDAERGDRFRPHRDNLSPSTADRRFAMTLNLNTEEYRGGELVFPEYGPHGYRPKSGGAVVFSCSLIHEALPVTEGRRFALLTFLRDRPGSGGGSNTPGS